MLYKYYKNLLKTAGIKKLIRIVALYHNKLYLEASDNISSPLQQFPGGNEAPDIAADTHHSTRVLP